MPHTLYLSPEWDICLTASGKIRTAEGDYAIAQNVANAVRLFTEDAYFAQDEGIPHFSLELGKWPAASVVRARVKKAALGVTGVSAASVTLAPERSLASRQLEGGIDITTTTGETAHVAL